MAKVPVNPFQTDPFISCWMSHLASKYELGERCGELIVYKKKVAKGLLVLNELKFIGANESWFNDFDKSQLESFLAKKDKLSWDSLYVVYAESRSHIQQFHVLEEQGYVSFRSMTKPMHIINLTQGYETYLANKTSKFRYQVKQKLSNAQALNPTLITYDRFEDIVPFYETFIKHHIPYWEAKHGASFFSHSNEKAFNIAYAEGLYRCGKLRLHGLMLNGEIANLSVSLIDNDALYFLLTINTGIYLDYFPGLVSFYLRLKEAADQGIKTFNMAFGDFVYKAQSQTHQDNRNVVIIPNVNSIKGRLLGYRLKHLNKEPKRGN